MCDDGTSSFARHAFMIDIATDFKTSHRYVASYKAQPQELCGMQIVDADINVKLFCSCVIMC